MKSDFLQTVSQVDELKNVVHGCSTCSYTVVDTVVRLHMALEQSSEPIKT